MNMGNLNKLALTAQEALQQTLSIASDAQASQAEPIHMLKALLESKENNLSAIIAPLISTLIIELAPCARASTPISRACPR